MLTDLKLRAAKPADKPYKLADRDGMYAAVSVKGIITFRLDYRMNGRRETLTLGRYGPDGLTLAEAREKALQARKLVAEGKSPAMEKQRRKEAVKKEVRFGQLCRDWLEAYPMAESTRYMRQSLIERDILPAFEYRLPEEVTEDDLRALLDKIVARDAPATAIHVREVINQVFTWAREKGKKYENPAADIRPSSIATFTPKDRALSSDEIRIAFRLLEEVPTLPTIRLGLRFLLLTLVRKGELLGATWDEVDFIAATWTIPAERMKRRRPHVVYLSQQCMDILIALKTCAGESPYLLPSRYDADKGMSNATFNRVTDSICKLASDRGLPLAHFGPHDLRRTASTILHEAGYNSDWIEKCLAHEQRGVRAVYNKAEYANQRREMLQQWADMVTGWIKGASIVPIGQARA